MHVVFGGECAPRRRDAVEGNAFRAVMRGTPTAVCLADGCAQRLTDITRRPRRKTSRLTSAADRGRADRRTEGPPRGGGRQNETQRDRGAERTRHSRRAYEIYRPRVCFCRSASAYAAAHRADRQVGAAAAGRDSRGRTDGDGDRSRAARTDIRPRGQSARR